MDGRKPVGTGLHLDVVRAALITPDAVIGFRGQGEDGMRHRGHVTLRRGTEQVTHEEVCRRIAIRQQRGTAVRTITHHPIIVLSPTVSSVSYFDPPRAAFVLLP